MVSSKDPDQVMDVKKPGKSLASATSRPIIVSHGGSGMMKDPMVRDAENVSAVPEKDKSEDQALSPKPEMNIKPPESTPSGTIEEETVGSTKAAAQGPEPEATTTDSPKQSSDDHNEEEKDESDKDDDAYDTEGGVINAVVGKADQKNKERQAAEAEAEKLAKIQKIIKDKTYYLPIHQVHKAKHGLSLFIVLAIFMLLIVSYALIDLEIIDIGFEVPYHIFNK